MGRDPVMERIIGCAIEVHRALGPGLLESAYERCMAYELGQHGMQFRQQVPALLHALIVRAFGSVSSVVTPIRF